MLNHYHSSQTASQFLKHFQIQKKKLDIEFLCELTRALSLLPYENVTKIIKNVGATPCLSAETNSTEEDGRPHSPGRHMGLPLRLPSELFADYLKYGTGGTCFSLTFFAYHILTQCGFVAYPVMADRSYGENMHCALIVILDHQNYLVDPGFLINKPILLKEETEFLIRTEFNVLCFRGGAVPASSVPAHKIGPSIGRGDPAPTYNVSTLQNNTHKFRYLLKTNPVSWDDFQKYWEESFHWSGMNSLFITTVHQGRQIYLHNNHLRIVDFNQTKKKKLNESEISSFLKEYRIDPRLVERALEIIKSI